MTNSSMHRREASVLVNAGPRHGNPLSELEVLKVLPDRPVIQS